MAKVCPVGFYCIEVGNLILIIVCAFVILIGYLTDFKFVKPKNRYHKLRYHGGRRSKHIIHDETDGVIEDDVDPDEIVRDMQRDTQANAQSDNLNSLMNQQRDLINEIRQDRNGSFQPPERHINIRTRGEPESYQRVGILQRSSGYQTDGKDDMVISGMSHSANILPLYGRQTYPGSNRWEYYYTSGDNKIILNKDGQQCSGDNSSCKEISNSDNVSLQEMSGDFTASIYPINQPRYLPNVI